MSIHYRVSARGIIIKDDKILLNEFGNGEYYNVPGGGIEPGETARQAVVREVMEETGLEVSAGDLIFVLEYEPENCGFMYGNTASISLFFRCCLKGSSTIKPPTIPDVNPDNPHITGMAKWVEISRINEINLLPYVHEQLMEYIKTDRFTPRFVEEPLSRVSSKK